jgi:hypothetical protein
LAVFWNLDFISSAYQDSSTLTPRPPLPPAGEGEEEYSLRGRSGDLFVAWFRYAIPIGAVPENFTARGLRYAANYTRLRRRFTHAPNGWGQPLNNRQPLNNLPLYNGE